MSIIRQPQPVLTEAGSEPFQPLSFLAYLKQRQKRADAIGKLARLARKHIAWWAFGGSYQLMNEAIACLDCLGPTEPAAASEYDKTLSEMRHEYTHAVYRQAVNHWIAQGCPPLESAVVTEHRIVKR